MTDQLRENGKTRLASRVLWDEATGGLPYPDDTDQPSVTWHWRWGLPEVATGPLLVTEQEMCVCPIRAARKDGVGIR